MADNVDLPATGVAAATDEAGDGSHVQIVKLALSANGSRTPITADTNGMQVQGQAAHDATQAGNPVQIAGRASAAAPTGVSGDDDVVRAWMLRNGATCVQLTASGALITGDGTNGLDVDVTRVPTDPFGANADSASASGSISAKLRFVAATGIPVTALPASTNTLEVVGDAAHDAAAAGNPVLMGGYASAAAPSGVSGDADVVRSWMLRNGATCVNLTAAGALIPGDASNGLDVDVTRLPALVAGTANIGDVDVLTVPADPFGVNADSASASGSLSAKLRFIASTGIPITTLPALVAGSAAIGKLAANSGVDIGDVDVTSLAGGTIAHDGADSGNPIKVGARAAGSLASATMVADGDRADNVGDVDGRQLVAPYCPNGDILVERISNTNGTSTASTVFGATSGARNCITSIAVANTSASAGFVDFRDGTSGTVLFTLPIPAGGGAVISFPVPLRQPTANTALAYDVSAALTTVYISLIGFKSKA